MKNYIPFIILSLLFCCQKQQDIPELVKKAFETKFSEAKHLKWTYENGIWEVSFYKNSQKYSSTFDEQGRWLETEHDINKNNLPLIILENLQTSYEKYEVDDVAFVESNEREFYEIELEFEGKDIEVLYNKEGHVVKEYINEIED
ncbi:PepSY-like domain-containing protein [Flavivirga abyssicola]|uniref:PepSY-like domain-containing protein n=1 Tax=Flavivirga abyssicola TaxID=3063533 RepID=UPI0026E0294C|nr:PepSY-like domain-containing protein [Flavivirga sp. MEBiC07777]WVK12744.1 PepSY-like domain-containing protein [Flavivirga sp. MEBiC07777]